MATPARITPSAVPKPAVASDPVLQWVSTPDPGATRLAPSSPMCRFAARSSARSPRLGQQALAPVGAGVGQAQLHARDRPHQVDRGRARGVEFLDRRLHARQRGDAVGGLDAAPPAPRR
jgi:hypothetical protein